MAGENLYYRTTFHGRHNPPNAVTFGRSPARHITLNNEASFVYNIRKYLDLSLESVSNLTGISKEKLKSIELEQSPASDKLILFYSKKLGVKPKYLEPLLNNSPNFGSEKFIKSIVNRYLNLVLSLKRNV